MGTVAIVFPNGYNVGYTSTSMEDTVFGILCMAACVARCPYAHASQEGFLNTAHHTIDYQHVPHLA